MEYLMTYGWAILIIAVVMGVLFETGFFSPGSAASQFCQLESGFTCSNYYLLQNGLLTVSILQDTSSPLNITAIGCNTNTTSISMTPVSPQVTLLVGVNSTFNVQCKTGASSFYGQVNQPYTGYLQINYTDLTTGFPQVIFGNINVKVAR